MGICKVDGQICVLFKPVLRDSDDNNYFRMQYSPFSNVSNSVRGKINMNSWALKTYLCVMLEW